MKPDNTEKHVKQAETIISKPCTHDTEGESAFLTKKKRHTFDLPYLPLFQALQAFEYSFFCSNLSGLKAFHNSLLFESYQAIFLSLWLDFRL